MKTSITVVEEDIPELGRSQDGKRWFWSSRHESLRGLVLTLTSLYLAHKKIGECYPRGYEMRLSTGNFKPDILIVLKKNYEHLLFDYLNGAADIVIEIVSEKSGKWDRGSRYYAYQEGGVPEYWIIDPISKRVDIFHLDDEGNYQPVKSAEGKITSRQLEGFELDTSILWQDDLPDGAEAVELVQAMLK